MVKEDRVDDGKHKNIRKFWNKIVKISAKTKYRNFSKFKSKNLSKSKKV